jgi:hypothetical protein
VGGLAHETWVDRPEVVVDLRYPADPAEKERCLQGELVVAQEVEEGVVRLIVFPEAGLDGHRVAADGGAQEDGGLCLDPESDVLGPLLELWGDRGPTEPKALALCYEIKRISKF